ncbi:TetR/AcrR family transcriptional regulator [Neomegalonema perideroedes]|uniref:TetR/AcrR family transcriptional regulator n=1 Tax=Neomegalonema perideroedes TaxID=217219 RepID=UPI000371E14C|nr:TetR/AcrR family transcriptional regulator [Neomegalonema perideroedes]
MPRKPLTEEEKALVRRKACRAARKLLHAEGSAGLTIRAVAAEIGMSAMSLYTYFENKAALLDYMRAMAVGELADIQETIASETPDATKRLAALGLAYQQYAESRPDDFRLAFGGGEGGFGAEAPEALREQIARAMGPSREAVAALVASKKLKGDAAEIHTAVWSAWHGYAMLAMAGYWPAKGRPDIEGLGLRGELTMTNVTPKEKEAGSKAARRRPEANASL